MNGRQVVWIGAVLAAVGVALSADPALGAARPSHAACTVAGAVPKAPHLGCGASTHVGSASDAGATAADAFGAGGLINGGKQFLTGNLGGAASSLLGGGVGSAVASATVSVGLSMIGGWVVGAASAVLHETAAALGATTSPQLQSTWFSATYWRMAAIAAMLTLPFLFAATVQAALRSDVALLGKAALGYLPLAILSIAIAAPLTTLLLAASDELCGLISAAAANQSAHVLAYASGLLGGLTAVGGSPFLAVLVGLLAIGAAFALWIELLLREAAVYVVVLMLPLAFAALAWPARRIWAVRGIEILIALILSKFAIVAVLSLGGAAIDASVGHASVSALMAGTVLIMLSALSPWALLRFVPLAEVAAGAAGALRGEVRTAAGSAERAVGYARSANAEWASRTTAGMKRDAERGMGDAVDGPSAARSRVDGSAGGGDPPPDGGDPATTVGGPPTPSAPNEPPTPGEPTAPREPPWSERPVLELGPDFGDTVVWPHEDAE